jgi:hypothetical protein
MTILNTCRFGDLKLQNPENKAFAQIFQKNFAGKILECHLNLLNVIRVGGYLPDRVINLVLQYLSNRFVQYAFSHILESYFCSHFTSHSFFLLSYISAPSFLNSFWQCSKLVCFYKLAGVGNLGLRFVVVECTWFGQV